MMNRSVWISAGEAAQLLRVSRATLYAYVSRGYVRSQAATASSRERVYAREDVDRLRKRTEARREPDKAAALTLQWGLPILESSIALIDGRQLYYRGHDAVVLSKTRSLAEVASLIWTGRFDGTIPPAAREPRRTVDAPGPHLPFVARAQVHLARASSRDPLAFDFRAAGVAATGWRILWLLAGAAALSRRPAPTIEAVLARAWGVNARGMELLRRALILCADHELNVSSFTARCVASAGSHPYAVVIAGLSALEGARHGGASVRVESMLDALRRARPVHRAIAERLRRGESLEGFGHPLYREGDPRAGALLDLLHEHHATSRERAFVMEVAAAGRSATRERPNLDFALAAMARVLRLPPGSALALFAIGRTIGWLGHAIEQYATGRVIRPRAKYVGAMPGTA